MKQDQLLSLWSENFNVPFDQVWCGRCKGWHVKAPSGYFESRNLKRAAERLAHGIDRMVFRKALGLAPTGPHWMDDIQPVPLDEMKNIGMAWS